MGLDRIVLGGSFGERDQEVTDALVACFAERGGVWLETAHAYADGLAERSVATAVAACPHPLRIATKVGHPDSVGVPTLGRRSLTRQIALSAERLQRPIDILILHRDDPGTPVPELLAPVVQALDRGIANGVGLSNWSLFRTQAAHDVLGDRLQAVSVQLSLVVPEEPMWAGTRAADGADLEWAEVTGVPLLAWSPLARGWIADPASAPPEARRSFSSSRNRRTLADCDRVASRHGLSRSAVALAGVLACGQLIRPILGAEHTWELLEAEAAIELADGPSAGVLRSLVRPRLGWA